MQRPACGGWGVVIPIRIRRLPGPDAVQAGSNQAGSNEPRSVHVVDAVRAPAIGALGQGGLHEGV